MNVHFSYKSSKSPDVQREVQVQMEKLDRRLQVFRPELVHLHGGFDVNTPRQGTSVSLNLRLPSWQLATQQTGVNGVAAVKAAFHELLSQLNAHKDLLRNRYKWHRKDKQWEATAFENTLAVVRPEAVSNGDVRLFINANLDRLASFIKRELRHQVTVGLLDANTVTAEEVLDEAVVSALGADDIPAGKAGLEGWLYKTALKAIRRLSNGSHGPVNPIHVEQPVRAQNVSGSDEEYLQFHQPDDSMNAMELIPDRTAGTPEDTAASEELIGMIESALHGAAPMDRDAFVLFAIEGFSVEEIARIAERSPAEITVSVERARQLLGRRLPAKESLTRSIFRQKLA